MMISRAVCDFLQRRFRRHDVCSVPLTNTRPFLGGCLFSIEDTYFSLSFSVSLSLSVSLFSSREVMRDVFPLHLSFLLRPFDTLN
jgi:hypothetical protein